MNKKELEISKNKIKGFNMLKEIKVIKRIILIGLVISSSLFALEESSIKNEMSLKIATITQVLQDKSFSLNEKKDKILPLVDGIFNYQTMSKIALGKAWKKLSNEQQTNFTQKFEDKLKNSYFEKLELYTDEKVVVKKLEKVKATRIKLYAEIVGVDSSYELIYKFYKVKSSSDWLIYDVEITGVSIIQTYRKQFSEFLKTKSFSELLNSL
jgi:phospholipid transport system substrate-binding protein